ncbi:MAG: hypothetical protein ACLRNQ_06740 [Flavonifractor plautii]
MAWSFSRCLWSELQKVFRRMRSRIGTKIGGAVLVAAGIALALY